jgi:hypothetical protein
VVIATGLHTVIGFLYYYNDPDVARKRRKAQSLAAMVDQELNAQVAENLLQNGNALLGTIAKLESQYSPEEVDAVLRILRGEKQEKTTVTRPQTAPQRPAFAQTVSTPELTPVDAPKAGAGKENPPQTPRQ